MWWGLLGGVWMLLVDTLSTAEAICAVAAALAGALTARLVLASGAAPRRASVRLLAGVVRQLARVPVDMWLLALALAGTLAGRRRPGRFHLLRLELAVNEKANARRAAIELVGSLAPNTIVLGVDEHQLVVHQLLARHTERESIREIGL